MPYNSFAPTPTHTHMQKKKNTYFYATYLMNNFPFQKTVYANLEHIVHHIIKLMYYNKIMRKEEMDELSTLNNKNAELCITNSSILATYF